MPMRKTASRMWGIKPATPSGGRGKPVEEDTPALNVPLAYPHKFRRCSHARPQDAVVQTRAEMFNSGPGQRHSLLSTTSCFIIYLNQRPKVQKIPPKTILTSTPLDAGRRTCFITSLDTLCAGALLDRTILPSPLDPLHKYRNLCRRGGHWVLRITLRETTRRVTSCIQCLTWVVWEVSS